jgi:hypothetical protein
MNKWLKLPYLPNDFWGECFVGWKSLSNYQVDPCIVMVRNFDGVVKWYCESLKDWFEFRDDIKYRVMVITFPEIGEEDFK